LVVVADQVTKSWATHRLAPGPIHVIGTMDLQLQYNSGSAFSLAQGWAPLLAVIAVVLVALLLGVVRHVRRPPLMVALGLVVGGALGNVADRLFRNHHGAVVDWIALHWWPTFNLADAAIVVGCLLAAVLMWRGPPIDVPSSPPMDRRPPRPLRQGSSGQHPS
jgi:signal peptidase II